MNDYELKKTLKLACEWSEQIGSKEASERLVGKQGVSIAVADKICNQRYRSTPREKLAKKLLKEMAKDGFTLDGKAS